MASPVTVSRDRGTGAGPRLELSGARLSDALVSLTRATEAIGGLEVLVRAVRLKGEAVRELFEASGTRGIDRARFEDLIGLMATVRRRYPALVQRLGWPAVEAAIQTLLVSTASVAATDEAMSDFCRGLGEEGDPRAPRCLRDLASEILHNCDPERFPLMHRWVWDEAANTGALREMWHDPDGGTVDHLVIDVPDSYETFLKLREELAQFLAGQGVFRDMFWHVDLLLAQVYGDYINAQGGAYLKTDFGAVGDPLEHTKRLMGLDRFGKGRSRDGRTIDEAAVAAPAQRLLS